MHLLKSAIAIAVLGLVASPVWADEDKPKDRPPRDGEQKQRVLEKFDKDGDGKLNEEEREAARDARRDKEGPRGERRRGEGRRGPDGPDGPPRGEGRRGPGGPDGPPGGPRPPMDPEKMFERLDENGDGHLSLDEFRDGMKKLRPPRPPRGFGEGDRRRGPGGPDGPRFRGDGPDGGPRDGEDGPREGRRPGRPPRPDADSDQPEPESDDEPPAA
ncbi:MAG: EF-hand domain-containing protein [Pirellulales bacterium]